MTATTGAITVPLPSGGAEKAITDPALLGILDFLAFCIRDGIGVRGIEQRPTEITNVLPTNNVFPFDPAGNWVRQGTPALYLWWPKEDTSKIVEYSTLYDARIRKLRLFYVCAEVVDKLGARIYAGLPAAIDAILLRASSLGRHPSYSYNDDPLGTPLSFSLNRERPVQWAYEGGHSDFYAAIPEIADRPGGPPQGQTKRGYPVLFGTVLVKEVVESEQFEETDRMPDITATINTNESGDFADTIEFMQGVLPAPDGSEDGDE
jgi:hypothetical protein